jgi:hypothetical protein
MAVAAVEARFSPIPGSLRVSGKARRNMRRASACAVAAFVVVLGLPALGLAQEIAGCKNGKFVGSYTHADLFTDIWGDGSGVDHEYLFQLSLSSDGTAYQNWTGLTDLMLSSGSASPWFGSWSCRGDGKLVVTLISATYVPTTDASNHPATVPDPPPVDLFLFGHTRVTYLFEVTDANTLTRLLSRSRTYGPAEDPSDPNGGTLRALRTTSVPYKRLAATDADLLAP